MSKPIQKENKAGASTFSGSEAVSETATKKGGGFREYRNPLVTVGGNEGNKCPYNTRLDTFGCGCQHDCLYCYSKSQLDYRNNWDADEPHVASIRTIEKEIQKLPKGSIVRMGGMSDCFMPLERELRITLETIRLLNAYGIRYLAVTKSSLIAEPEYMAAMDKNLAHVQISVTCMDDVKAGEYEKASPPSERIKAIYALQDAGFDIALRISPFIEEYMDIQSLNSLRVDKCLVEFLRINHWIKKWLPGVDYDKYTLYHGGYNHLPLGKKAQLIKQITLPNVSICEDVDEHFIYWRDRQNPNKLDCCNLCPGGGCNA